ncbi:U32 family peptidase [Pseudomonas sp. RL]|uniref:U32 family peptidase n=1 Tax=Pseudomonas sp. RL TaxID=1452718 RepID=UPI0004832954|nr:U32 family peptidase [Pseudomonas sp. RL]
MKLSLGPVLFYWTRETLQNFYAEMLEQPLDIIYLGETVCSKRRAFSLDGWLGLARELREAGCQAELVLSGLTLIEAASELSSLRRLCNNGELLVEANDIGAVQMLSENRLPFVAGPALNIYNGHALAELIDLGMRRWCPPVEVSGALVRDSLQQLDTLGVPRPEVELFAYGHLPLAYSARCFTARAENRPKDDCEFVCQNYPEGIPLLSQEGEAMFTINGIQTMSARVCNLLAEYPQLRDSGVDILRLSPRAEGMAEIIRGFDAVRGGALPPLAIDGCNGYWYGQPGMLRAEEVGLC